MLRARAHRRPVTGHNATRGKAGTRNLGVRGLGEWRAQSQAVGLLKPAATQQAARHGEATPPAPFTLSSVLSVSRAQSSWLLSCPPKHECLMHSACPVRPLGRKGCWTGDDCSCPPRVAQARQSTSTFLLPPYPSPDTPPPLRSCC